MSAQMSRCAGNGGDKMSGGTEEACSYHERGMTLHLCLPVLAARKRKFLSWEVSQ
jgi:hypothetical protein